MLHDQRPAADAASKSNSPPLKIEIISPTLAHQADSPYSTRMRARAIQATGCDVEVFAFPDVYPPAVGELGVRYCGISRVKSARSMRWMAALRKKLGNYWRFIFEPYFTMRAGFARAAKRGCAMVFIADVEPWISFLLFAELWLRRYPVPIVGQIPGNYDAPIAARLTARVRCFLNHRFSTVLPKFIDVVGTSKHILATLFIDKSGRAVVVPEGHESRMGTRSTAEARARLKLPPTDRILLLFGVASKAKGADILFEALEKIPANFTVCIVGMTGDVYEDSWGSTERLQKAGWTEKLHIVSRFVTEDEMQDYYAACDAVVIPYKKGFAGTSTHLRRASEYGKAIVGCDQYHIGDQVRKYDLGLVFKTDDADALAESLRRFAAMSAADFEQIKTRSYRLLEDESWANVGKMYRKLFESILARRSAQR